VQMRLTKEQSDKQLDLLVHGDYERHRELMKERSVRADNDTKVPSSVELK
jgi:hypothetical protein